MTLQDSFAAACCQVLRERRQMLALSQEEVARRSGLARSYVCDVERGARHPSMRNLSILARSLNISVADLVSHAELSLVGQLDLDDLRNDSIKADQEEIYEYINNKVKNGIIVADRDRLIFVNQTARKMAGLNGDLPDGNRHDWYFAPDGKGLMPDTDRPLSKALRGESVDDVSVMLKNEHIPEGRLVAMTARPLKSAAGILAGVMLMKPAT